jgi:hypothetical protein
MATATYTRPHSLVADNYLQTLKGLDASNSKN